MKQQSTLVNALIGAVVSVVVAFVPFSPVIGGAVAAYLEEGDRSDAIRVSALAGVFGAIPLLLLLPVLLVFVSVLPAFGAAGSATALFGLFGFVIIVFVVLYTVGLSMLGGILGWYLLEETDSK